MSDLIEQHPELRPELISTRSIHEHNRSHLTSTPGSYEWWQLDAFNANGDGLSLVIFNGNPFDFDYTTAVRRRRAGRHLSVQLLRPTTYPAIRIGIFKAGRIVAGSYVRFPAGAFRETDPDQPWSIEVGGSHLGRRGGCRLSESGDGWKLSASVPAGRVFRPIGRFNPRHFSLKKPRVTIHVEADIQPAFECQTLKRLSMPDSPAGDTHEWLIACPTARVDGRITLEPDMVSNDHNSKTKPDNESNEVLMLDRSLGGLDHFWGTGPVGGGIRRWHRARLPCTDGAVLTELTIIRKYIQLAGTLMWFRPGDEPVILRCERPQGTTYHRAAWLLAYPTTLQWQEKTTPAQIEHEIKQTGQIEPYRVMAVTSAMFEAGVPPEEVTCTSERAVFEMIQPARLHWPLWRLWVRPESLEN